MIGSASWVEIVWSATALAGLIVCIWALVDAVADLHYLQALGLNGAREIIAFGSARNESFSVVIQALFFMVGVIAMLSEPARRNQGVSPLSIVIASVLCTAAVLLVLKALMDRRDRHRVIEILSRKDVAK